MEELITFLAIVALVAVAFGISMTSAFWGIITFIVGAVVILSCSPYLALERLDSWHGSIPLPNSRKLNQRLNQSR